MDDVDCMTNILQNITTLKQQILDLEIRYHRPPDSVSLLAVSKGQPAEHIRIAVHAGQTTFGENYLQEALAKITALKNLELEWHYLGATQSNKTRHLAEHFAWVHTVCDLKTAERLNQQRPEHLPPLNICLQVNISADKNKAGADENAILPLAVACAKLPRLNLRGLMTVPAEKNIFAEQRAELHKMAGLFQKLLENQVKIDTLSMGMSADLEAAIAEGSTMIRIGTKIFGSRI